MRVLLDTNIILDVVLERGEWLKSAEVLWDAGEAGTIENCVTASCITDLFYIIRKLAGVEQARAAVRQCLDRLTVLPTNAQILDAAFQFETADYEDAVQLATALQHGIDAIVTRDRTGFAGASVPVLSPDELIARL